MTILIIADDLSGAADCAIRFADEGHPTVVGLAALPHREDQDGWTLSIDADTRRLAPEEAASRTRAIYAEMKRPGRRLYKKIDSTLRGNWAAEVAALRPVAGMAIVAPAHPILGRTVIAGHVHVHGEPLESTETWKLEHAHRPAGIAVQLREAGLTSEEIDVEPLQQGPEELAFRIAQLAARGVDCAIVNATSGLALSALARATLQSDIPFFWVGSGGLAREIAALCPAPAAQQAPRIRNSGGPTLILVGSLSRVTARQCTVLLESGAVEQLVAMPSLLRAGPSHHSWNAVHVRIGELLAGGKDLLLRIGREQGVDPSGGPLLSRALARLVGPHFAKSGAVIATGGETARAMLVEAEIDRLRMVAELQTGVALGIPSDENRPHRPWIVTKAGGFGTERTLHEAWLALGGAPPRTPDASPFHPRES